MSGELVVATSNVRCGLRAASARQALHDVLDLEPDLIGLQEWRWSRRRFLRRVGPGYLWVAPRLGDCPVGARGDRFEPRGWHSYSLGGVGRADAATRAFGVVPPRFATVAVFWDRQRNALVSLVNFHLLPGVQAQGRYREDRPLLTARHRREVARLERLVSDQLALEREVHAVGDSNFDGLRLPGLTSAWEGREDMPGTLGPGRKIDDVHGPGPAASVILVSTTSDHKAVVVRR